MFNNKLREEKAAEKEQNNMQEDAAQNGLITVKKSKTKKVWATVKWGLGLAILIAGIVFVLANKDICYNQHETSTIKGHKELVELTSNSLCIQEFKGYNGTLKSVGIYMDNEGRETSKGEILLTIKDESGNVIGETSKAMKKIKTRKFAMFDFAEPPAVEKDKIYTMEIQCKDVYNSQGFGLYTVKGTGGYLTGNSIIDGKSEEDPAYIRTMFVFEYYDVASMFRMTVIFVFALILIFIPYDFISKKIKEKSGKDIDTSKWMSRIVFVLAPLVAYFMMDSLSGYTIKEIILMMISMRGVLNLALYGVILLIAYAITNKTQYSAIILWVFTLVLGLTNYFVFRFRGIPVLAADIMSVGTALNVADSFEYTYDIWVLWAVALFTAATGVMLSLAPYKGFKKIKRLIVIAVTVVIALGANWFYINTDNTAKLGIEDSQWKPQLTYAENGSLLSFTTSWKYVKTEKPAGYSVSEIEKITSKYPSDDTDKTRAKNKKMPNVITIMNESLADFDFVGELKTSEDYLPFIRSMKENTIKGKLYVSIWGANTANSEFEFLTGNTLAFFAPRSVPYNNYVNGIVPSLTRTLAAQGYVGNDAFHPYKRSGWNREHVYNCLGFNNFYSEEYYENREYVRNFTSDKTNMEQIIKDYEAAKIASADPFYMFNVTVQNHGGYAGNRGFVDINVTSDSPGMDGDDVNQYLTLAKKSDEAFELLIKYFEKVDEPTVIVMFGDHQPPLSDEFYSNIFGTPTDKLSTEQTAQMYSTPYVIWANYDIEENDSLDMSANYLSSYLLKLIGADMTGYNKYLLDLQKKVPIITGLFYAGDDGVLHPTDEKSEYSKVIKEYSQIQYNGLFDRNKRLDDFFFLKDGNYQVEDETEE